MIDIDPAYNTRDKDWKYNNDYVDSDDVYRHSKWLAMMQRRLRLARRLPYPTDSVLIVTIDEKEYLRLGLLLEQPFPASRIQMVTSVINRKGSPRRLGFSRVEDYLFFVYLGEAGPGLNDHNMLSDPNPAPADGEPVTWVGLRRRGSEWRRTDRKGSFLPIFVDRDTAQIVKIGDPLPPDGDRHKVRPVKGCLTVWPLNWNGAESRWQLSADSIWELLEQGYLRSSFQRNGKGVTLEVDGDDFYIDLLFFNWAQNRFVVIELKIGNFEPAHLGQLGFYVSWIDQNLRQPEHHSPTIGILLCAGRNDKVVRYALASATAPLAVADYTYDTLPPSL